MLDKKIESLLNEQVAHEQSASQHYLAMASWAEIRGYKGISKFFFRQSDEERVHMLRLFHFINDRGGHALVPSPEASPKSFKNVDELFEHTLQQETIVSSEINKLVDVCLQLKDYTTYNFLQWYVAEQIEEEKQARDMLDKLNLIGNDKGGMYLFDRDLGILSDETKSAH